MVRTNHVGHLRDVRRLVVALSRARLGLYILARVNLFKNCFELTPAFSQLCKRSTVLELLPNELFGTKRLSGDPLPMKQPVRILDTDHMVRFSHEFYVNNLGLLTERYQKEQAEIRAREEARRAKEQEAMEAEAAEEKNEEVAEANGIPNIPEGQGLPQAFGQPTESSEGAIVFESVEFERLEKMPTY